MRDRKDRWDALGAIAGWVGVVVAVVALVSPARDEPSDAEKIAKFYEVYDPNGQDPAARSARRLVPFLIDQISSACVRQRLRRQVIWGTLEHHVLADDASFRFDREHSDWHLVGDLLLRMRDDDGCDHGFRRWWVEDLKAHTTTIRWREHSAQLAALYDWLDTTYLGGAEVLRRAEWIRGALPTRTRPDGADGIVIQGIFIVYSAVLALLILLALHRLLLVVRFHAFNPRRVPTSGADLSCRVLVQLPIYNEQHVASRIIDAAARLEWPSDRLQIQVLDDSTDATSAIVASAVADVRLRGIDIQHLQRGTRHHYKAGALAWGLEKATDADFVCIFDADFDPSPDFLRKAVVHFSDPSVGMVQARWTHINHTSSWLTRLQSVMLDGHFVVDHEGRHRSGCFFNFNGTAGIWRRSAILDAGGWEGDTLTEDLDLSYRAQLRGWKFVYRSDIVAPSELPRNVLAWKAQQRRWSQGSLQTARKLLGSVWRSRVSLRRKLEATAHLLSNTSYLLIFAAGCLSFPVHAYGGSRYWTFVYDLEVVLLAVGILVSALFYSTAGRFVRRRRVASLAWVGAIMLFGMGISANNAVAALRGLFAKGGTFVRTPKYGTQDEWWRTPYSARQPISQLVFEVFFFLYLCSCAVMTWMYLTLSSAGAWKAMTFPVLFATGTGCVIAMTVWHLILQSRGARARTTSGGGVRPAAESHDTAGV